MAKTLVAYFSASGTTKRRAQELAGRIDADMVEISPKVAYSAADLDWSNRESRSTREMKDPSSRPAIIEDGLDMSLYKRVYLGFPIWWYIAPTIINTWLEAHIFKGQDIILFATSGGSGFGKTVQNLTQSAPDAHIQEGAVIRGTHDIDKLIRLLED